MPDIFAVRRPAVSAKPVLCFLLRSFNGRIHHLMRVISFIELFFVETALNCCKKIVIFIIAASHDWPVNLDITMIADHVFTASPISCYEHCSVPDSRFSCYIQQAHFLISFTTPVFVEAHAFYSNFSSNKGFQEHLYYPSITLHFGFMFYEKSLGNVGMG